MHTSDACKKGLIINKKKKTRKRLLILHLILTRSFLSLLRLPCSYVSLPPSSIYFPPPPPLPSPSYVRWCLRINPNAFIGDIRSSHPSVRLVWSTSFALQNRRREIIVVSTAIRLHDAFHTLGHLRSPKEE